MLKRMDGIGRSCLVAGALLCILSFSVATASAEKLSASTVLTIVHLTSAQPNDISFYPGAWPSSKNATLQPTGMEVYLHNVVFGSHMLSWNTTPRPTPYPSFGNGINSILTAVWSKDGGHTFSLLSWDYLGPTTSYKHLRDGMPDCWMGTMISTLCDQKPGECNGRYRSNLYFTEYPQGASCWGTMP